VSAWLGLALAALFFYPLATALSTGAYYLQWQVSDLVETTAVIAVLACVVGAAVFVLWPRSTRTAHVTLLLLSALPLASFAAGVSRQLPFQTTLIAAGEAGSAGLSLSLAAAAAGAAAVVVAFLARPAAFGRWLRRLLVIVSPASLVVLASLASSAAQAGGAVRIDRPPAAAGALARACAPVLVLLFDELSFYYVYDLDDNLRSELPALGRFGTEATHYVSVAAPGRGTLEALPSLLAARPLREIEVRGGGLMEVVEGDRLVPFDAARPDGLFGTARSLGYRTEIAGYYLAYCEMLGAVADVCRSRSFYNVSSPERFSLVDPVATTLVLWPRQLPFGVLKNPPFARHQREMVEELTAFARRPIERRPPTFRFVHFSIPHLPFVFDAEGYDPPFDPLMTSPDEEYRQQIQYVDRLVGELMDELRRRGAYDETTIVVLADHGYRFGGSERDAAQIPFLVKSAGQTRRAEVRDDRQGERLLKAVVEGACRA
jgi:hypothetical protein